jgi:hypothetical protein
MYVCIYAMELLYRTGARKKDVVKSCFGGTNSQSGGLQITLSIF